ncbi:MAG: hypothetical protein K2L80_07405 [Muribaculaceae bacterium]|nr:hypothetical protein [Muribaculaceae bacterium]
MKRHFFAMRNGIVADTLRRAGSPYHIIFGLNLPQLAEIASLTPHTVELSDALHANSSTRCSCLMAPMIHPHADMSHEKALRWMSEALCTEETDVLCHRLLRHLPYACDVANEALAGEDRRLVYGGLRLIANLRSTGADVPLPDMAQYIASPFAEIASLARMLSE